MKNKYALPLGGLAAALACLATGAHAALTGTFVHAVPGDLAGNTVVQATQAAGGFYDGPHDAWVGNPADGQWLYGSAEGGIAPDGLSSGVVASNNVFGDFVSGATPPMLQTSIVSLDPLGLYDVYVQYVTADWVAGAGAYGINAGFDGGPTSLFNHEQPGNVQTFPQNGLIGYEGLIGNTQAVGGEIRLNIEVANPGSRSYYAGVSYLQTGQVPEPSTGILVALSAGLVLIARRRRRS